MDFEGNEMWRHRETGKDYFIWLLSEVREQLKLETPK